MHDCTRRGDGGGDGGGLGWKGLARWDVPKLGDLSPKRPPRPLPSFGGFWVAEMCRGGGAWSRTGCTAPRGGGSGVGLSPPRGSLAREIWGGGWGGAERWSRGGPRIRPGAARAPFGAVPLGSQAPQEEIIITIIIIIITKKEKKQQKYTKKKDLNRQVRFPEQRN